MVSIESTKSLIEEARGNILILMQDVQEVDTEWADEMWDAHIHLTRALTALDQADNPVVVIDTDRALDDGYPVVCPLTKDDDGN